MSKHTPGPWKISIDDKCKEVWILGEKQYETIEEGGKGCQIAEMLQVYFDHDKSYEIKKANAHLIAAAPDLLAALESVLEDSDNVGHSEYSYQTAIKILAAIAKAKGEL